ncbi:hypothetical protein DOK67_0000938 [Enterococcus sp. DIV0212c]|uniref:DUF4176 domain-containing protein n=1 Tax=Enterococcus sp. DIV0212c TaxID=2230867 RepID=UPI001A9C1924|nr:DUF4176 domain-containing protein [Enterococcus sp. DIV0212c]MBO1352637.1 DUF4176 domain-containing protein [Enterococcus sp. DIV0212c]
MEKKLYPLGTIVYLKEGTQKIMVVARGVVYQDEETKSDVFVDYMGCAYPEGIDPSQTLFFNEENIDQVVHEGFSDEDELRFIKVYEEWESGLNIPKKKID